MIESRILTECGRDLKEQEKNAMLQFPPWVLYEPGDEKNVDGVDSEHLAMKLIMRLEHLNNLFLIERLLGRLGRGSIAKLIEMSFELLTLTNIFWKSRERLSWATLDLEWLVMVHAAPASAVLCMELLRPQAITQGSLSVTRSDIVQQLSMLIGFLDWVGPDAPNATMCRNVKRVVGRVLDEAINGTPVVQFPNQAVDASTGNLNVDFSSDLAKFFSLDSVDTHDWLDTYDWLGQVEPGR